MIDFVLGIGSKEIIVLGLKKFNLAREVHIPAHFEYSQCRYRCSTEERKSDIFCLGPQKQLAEDGFKIWTIVWQVGGEECWYSRQKS